LFVVIKAVFCFRTKTNKYSI